LWIFLRRYTCKEVTPTTKLDAIAQLQDLRNQAQSKAHPRSRLCIQEYMDADTAADDVAALTMAIKALQADRGDTPVWACALWCLAAAIIGAACVIYAMA